MSYLPSPSDFIGLSVACAQEKVTRLSWWQKGRNLMLRPFLLFTMWAHVEDMSRIVTASGSKARNVRRLKCKWQSSGSLVLLALAP